MLRSLEKFVKRVKMEVNVKKSKIMVFQNGGRRAKGEKWKFNEQEIEKLK